MHKSFQPWKRLLMLSLVYHSFLLKSLFFFQKLLFIELMHLWVMVSATTQICYTAVHLKSPHSYTCDYSYTHATGRAVSEI